MVISGGIIKRKVFLRAWIVLCMLLNAVTPQAIEDKGISACELESLVRQILNPNPEYQMHANALRDQLRGMIQTKISDLPYQSIDDTSDYFDEDKRSISSLARSGIIPNYGKRYLGALAKSGMMLRSNSYDDFKRSVATLAKNGQLPTQEPDTMYDDSQQQQLEEKRNLGSLAKSGGLGSGKRNIGTLARDYQLPTNGKRNLAALARLGLAPKRNIASLARQNSYYMAEKKNIAALKNSPVHGQRQKRDAYGDLGDYEVPDDVIQNYSMDYDDLKNQLNQLYGNGPYEEKRFLGSVAKNGWLRPSAEKRNIGSLARLGLLRSFRGGGGGSGGSNSYNFRQQEEKRHIGALARSGWLSAFRPVRSARFSRSGRARSRTVGYYPQQERLLQPTAAVCRRCDYNNQEYSNTISWKSPTGSSNGLSRWGTPPRLTALHWRSLRPTTYY